MRNHPFLAIAGNGSVDGNFYTFLLGPERCLHMSLVTNKVQILIHVFLCYDIVDPAMVMSGKRETGLVSFTDNQSMNKIV